MKIVALAGALAVTVFNVTEAKAQSWLCEGPNCQDGLFRQIELNFNEAWKRVEATHGAVESRTRINAPTPPPSRPGPEPEFESCSFEGFRARESYQGPAELLIGVNQAVVKLQGQLHFNFLRGGFPVFGDGPAPTAQTYTVSFKPGAVEATTQVAGLGNVLDETFSGDFLLNSNPMLHVTLEASDTCVKNLSFHANHIALRAAFQERAKVVFETAVRMALGM